MKNCIYDLVCMENPAYLKYEKNIVEKCCNCSHYNCGECLLFLEVESQKDFEKSFKEIILKNENLLEIFYS